MKKNIAIGISAVALVGAGVLVGFKSNPVAGTPQPTPVVSPTPFTPNQNWKDYCKHNEPKTIIAIHVCASLK